MAAESPSTWDVSAAIRDCPIRPWSGPVWRCHARKYAGDDAGGSLRTTGRFHRGADKFPANETWPALYTSLALHVALGERLRHTTPAALSALANQRVSQLRVNLHAVLILCAPSGCADLGVAGLDGDSLCRPADSDVTHQIAQIARGVAEGLIFPSCTRFPEGNLIVFPDCLRTESTIVVDEILDPDLFVDWDKV